MLFRSNIMKRREFIGLLGGAALATQNGAFAQPSRTARIGILSGLSADDIETKNRLKAMRDGLSKLGWIEGRNIQIDARMAGTSGNLQAAAQDLIDTVFPETPRPTPQRGGPWCLVRGVFRPQFSSCSSKTGGSKPHASFAWNFPAA